MSFTSNTISVGMVQISFLLIGLLVIGSWAAPTIDELKEVYVDTCQVSCGKVTDNNEKAECREKFCPNYVSYILTGDIPPGESPSLVSTHHKEVANFCATWMVQLIQSLGWNTRIHLKIKQCNCAAGADCLVK